MHKAFRVHMLSEKGKAAASEIAAAFDDLGARLFLLVPDGRERSIVMTKLEEACFFAKKAIAEIPGNVADAATTIIDRPRAIELPPVEAGDDGKGAVRPDDQAELAGGETEAARAPAVLDAKTTRPAGNFSERRSRPAPAPRPAPPGPLKRNFTR